MATPYLVGENETVAVHVTGQRALGYRVDATYRSTAKLMRQQDLPAWVREIEATEFPEYGKAVAAAKRILNAGIAAVLASDQAELDRRLDERDRDPYGDGR